MLSHLKQRVNDILDVSSEVRRPTGVIDYALLALILLNVASVILETVEDWGEAYGEAFYLFEIASVAIFTVEYLLPRIPQMDCQFDDLLGRFCYKNQCNTIIATGQTRLTLRVTQESSLCGSISTAA